MANLNSSKKNIRRMAKATARNRTVTSQLKTLRKSVDNAVKEGEAETLKTAAKAYVSALDKAAKRNIIHANRVNRQKAQCARYLSAV